MPELPLSNPTDDVSGAYLGHAQAQSADGEIAAFRERMRAQQSAAPAAAPAAPDGAPAAPSKGNITVWPAAWGPNPNAPAPEPASMGKKIVEGAASAAADVASGVMKESPAAVAGGITDAFRNAAAGLNDVGNWLNNHVADLQIGVPSSGVDAIDAIVKPFLNPLESAASLEKLPAQKTVTGGVIREAARFLTGFVPAVGALRAAGVAEVPAIISAGAASDFATADPEGGGLSNLIESVPALKNPVTKYLATDPNDADALNRVRHAVEGAGFGGLAEGVFRGIRALAQAKKAARAPAVTEASLGEATARDMLWLGDPAADHVLVARGDAKASASSFDKMATAVNTVDTGVPDQVAAAGIAKSAKAGSAAPEVYVNFARIDTPTDVQKTIADMANAFKGEIDSARRGVQTNEQTKALADKLGMTPEDLLARRPGQPLSAEEALAARRLWATSATKLLQAAEKASDFNAGPVDLFNFRRMLAIHHAIQTEVIAARTETARALQSWSIPAGAGGAEKGRAIEQLMEASGGVEVSQELARRFATLANSGLPDEALAAMTRRGWAATTMDMVKESYVLGLLWSPTTHAVNTGSNMVVAFQQIYERGAARAVGDFLGTAAGDRVVDGEALAMTYGMISSLKDAFRLAARTARSGQTGTSISKLDMPRQGAISSETIARERGLSAIDAAAFIESPMGRTLDFIGNTTRIPGNLLAAEDEFFKTIAYRAEVHAQGLRMATQEGRSGSDLFRRMAEIANNPPENIRLAAADASLYATFQQQTGWVGKALMTARNSGSLNPTFVVLPFIKTPTNILRYTFERSPLAPLVGQWRDDIAAGGARRDLALARMGTGTGIVAVAMDLASSGLITGAGPKDPGKLEALKRSSPGWQPFSIPIGGVYHSFNRADPVGMLLGFAGTAAEKLKEKDASPEDFDSWEEIMGAAIGVVAASVVDKTYFTGVAQVMTAIQGSESGPMAAAHWIDRTTGSLVPFSSLFSTINRFVDPVTREVNSPWDAIQAKITGLTQNLGPVRDLWGAERKPQEIYGRVYDALSPVAVSGKRDSPVDDELVRLGGSIRRLQKKEIFQGADVNFRDFPAVYDEYVRLAGNELKHPAWGLGAKDFLDAVVTGQHPLSDIYRLYSDGAHGGKESFIANTVADYRKLAQQQIMAEPERWPAFYAYVMQRSGVRKQQRAPLDPALTGAPVDAPASPL